MVEASRTVSRSSIGDARRSIACNALLAYACITCNANKSDTSNRLDFSYTFKKMFVPRLHRYLPMIELSADRVQ